MIRALRIRSDGSIVTGPPDPDSRDVQWIDLDETDPDRLFELAERFDIGETTIDSILSDPDRPKIDTSGRHLHVALHSLGLDAMERLDTVEYDLILGTRWIMSIRREPIPVVDWLWAELVAGQDYGVRSPADVLSLLALYGTRRFPPVVEALAAQADQLGVDALTGARGILSDIQTLLRAEVILRTALRAQRTVMEQLAKDPGRVPPDARERFADAADLHRALVDDLLTARTILQDAVNTYRGAVAEQTGDVTRVLTVYAAVMLPMTLITGIWGMNVAGLPWADDTRGFEFVMAVMLVVGLISTGLFVRVGYLSRPKPPDPRRLARLLGALVTLPVRAVRPSRRARRRARQRTQVPTETSQG